MSLRINHNIAAINGHRNMLNNDMAVSKSLERLSSGLRINRAADDAAGLVISEQMRAQITGLDQATHNSETAVSMVQTAEGALNEVNTLLNKARSLTLHAGNEGANDQNQLSADQAELDNIVSSVSRIAEFTQFGTKKILDGTLSSARSNDASIGSVKLGSYYANGLADKSLVKGFYSLNVTTTAVKATLTIAGLDSGTVGTGLALDTMISTDQFQKSFSFSVGGTTVAVTSGSTKKNLVDQLNAIGKNLGFVATTTGTALLSGSITLTAKVAGTGTTFDFAFVGGYSGASLISGTYASGTDIAADIYFNTGVAGAVANSDSTNTLTLSGKDLLLKLSGFRIQLTTQLVTGFYNGVIDGTTAGATFQIGANVGQKATVELASAKAGDLGVGGSGTFASLDALKGSSLLSGQADEALKVIDKAIDDVTVTRGKLGAFQANTLESGLNSLRTTHENLTAAESTIRDVDFAEESANFTKNNILIQASTAMLAQANQLPQNVLSLLRG